MPTPKNITKPITLIGNGRSGTSLVSKVLSAHPDCFFAGETVNLIHSVWRSLECSLPANRHTAIPETLRRQFLYLFPSKQRHWMQKPIGIPIISRTFGDESDFYDWYWEVPDQTFPDARFFTVLRHPLDILISSDEWWDYGLPAIIESNRKIAKLLTHPRSKVTLAVNYHELIANPGEQVTRLFEGIDIPTHARCLEMFDTGHVLNQQNNPGTVSHPDLIQQRRQQGFSHRDKWHTIDPVLLTPDYRESIEACWDRYGYSFGSWDS